MKYGWEGSSLIVSDQAFHSDHLPFASAAEVIMTPSSHMISIRPDASLEACMALMTIHHVRLLPVFAGERLVGMISSRVVIKALIAEKNGFINNLRDLSDTLFTQSFDDDIAGGKG